MNEKQFNKLMEMLGERQDESLKLGIEKYVNGKIRDLSKKIDEYIALDTAWKQEDRKWKDEQVAYRKDKLDPIVETSGHTLWLGRSLKGWLAFVVLFGAALAVVKTFFK